MCLDFVVVCFIFGLTYSCINKYKGMSEVSNIKKTKSPEKPNTNLKCIHG